MQYGAQFSDAPWLVRTGSSQPGSRQVLGGCWWSSSKTYKNSITNALWLALTGALHATSLEPAAAKQLAELSGGRPFESLSRARESWAWIEQSGLRRGAEELFLDGLSSAQCNASYGNDPDANVTWTCAIHVM